MYFNDIELPDELWRARNEDNLVIFAGAGVSYGPPSSLPLFSGLVEQIARGAATAQEDNESLDRFLGRLRHNGNMVHELGSSILLDPASHPNPLHDLLLRLFGKPEAIRLVTTNFDRHFTSACQARWPNVVREYYAPALKQPADCFYRGAITMNQLAN
jgi:NAD-dependent SIR2 family protein deacetylase